MHSMARLNLSVSSFTGFPARKAIPGKKATAKTANSFASNLIGAWGYCLSTVTGNPSPTEATAVSSSSVSLLKSNVNWNNCAGSLLSSK